MRWIKVGAAVLNQTPLDWPGNLRRIRSALEEARRQEVRLLCLPELSLTGYGCEDAFHSPGVQTTTVELLREIAAETEGMALAVGIPLLYRKALFNVVALLADGSIWGFVAKRHLAGDGLYYEPRWFRPWPRELLREVEIAGETYPIGDLHFSLGGIQVGFEICEDAWVASRAGSALAARGVDILLNPSASHFAFGKHDVRKRFVLEGSRAFGVTYVYSNLLGNEAGRMVFDGGALVASGGRLLAEGPRFSYQEVHVTSAMVDVDSGRMAQARTGSFQPDLEARPGEEVEVPFHWPDIPFEVARHRLAPWEEVQQKKEEEFTRAVSLALFDYLRKSRSQGFVVSLSGGADSAAVACLVACMVRLAASELGRDRLRQIWSYIPGMSDCETLDQMVRRLLLTVYQATENSSTTTREAASTLARALGAEHLELEVEGLVRGYREMISEAIGRPLTWQQDDLALQNIQARVRSPGAWMLANLRGALLLATSNRSEAAVGYATMDGDTSGGLSPIAGIDKAFLRHWLRWMEAKGPFELEPIPQLAVVTRQAPTAELRPQEAEQTDEDDLMPYEILDAIERAAIRDKKLPVPVYRTMRAAFPEVPPDQMAAWVEKFFRLWCRNQWKRERYAPSFHVDDENLDPKTWCRFPILSGGFERELEELAAYREKESAAEVREAVVD